MSSMADKINDRERELERENKKLREQVGQLKEAVKMAWTKDKYIKED